MCERTFCLCLPSAACTLRAYAHVRMYVWDTYGLTLPLLPSVHAAILLVGDAHCESVYT